NPLTATRHRQIFDKYFSTFKDKKLSELREEDIRESLQRMLSNGIKSKAFNNATSTLNKINDYCVYNHLNCVNIRDKISEFRKCKMVGKNIFARSNKRESELAFNEHEAIIIIRYALEHPDYANLAIAALITTGVRSGELLALTPYDVDIDKGLIYVEKMEQAKSYEIIDHCKDGSERTVFLNSDAKTIFNRILELRLKDASTCGYLFLNPFSEDGKLHLRALDNRLRKIQAILGMTDYIPARSPHDCRRTYASIQYLHGVDIKTIQAQLGHSNAQQTWDYIRDIVDTNTRANKLEQGCIL
ncbi:MAG: tyrosine-type recombinase/integrase, partial [Lachnospiraceae bacterium]|nr:tyrosine-type recombinase/integrase [Lachnospiraceae bacterium]